MTYKDFHNEMDHCGNDLITLMVKAMGINLLGNHLMSPLYSGENLKNKNPKKSEKCSTEKGEQLYFDISSIKQTSMGKCKYWMLCMDRFTGFRKSFFPYT